MRRRPSSPRELAAAGASAAIALAFLEAWVRFFHAAEVDPAALAAANAATSIAPITVPSACPELVYELKPSQRTLWNGIKVETDESGLRVSPRRRSAPPGAFRLAVLGDSSSFGWGVDHDDAYPSRLAGLLEKRLGRAVVLRNYSVPGYNSPQHLLLLRERVLPWKPDLILLHYDHNDADPLDTKPAGYMPADYGDNPLGSALWKFAARRLRARRAAAASAGGASSGPKDLRLHHYLRAGPRFEAHIARIEAMAAAARASRIPMAVYLFNVYLSRTDDPESDPFYVLLHRSVSRRLEAMGLDVIDGYPLAQAWMRARSWKDLRPTWLSGRDAHPSPLGHALIAEELVKTVRVSP